MMVNHSTNGVAQLQEWSVHVLKTDQTHSTASASAMAAQALAGAGDNKASSHPNTVLKVNVKHMIYPVTLDVVCQIFSRVSKVMKIVLFTKNNKVQALI